MACTADDKPKASSRTTLEIIAPAGEGVMILASPLPDTPSPLIFEGAMPASGALRLRVPRFPLLVITTGYGKTEVRFEESESFRRVDLHGATAADPALAPSGKNTSGQGR